MLKARRSAAALALLAMIAAPASAYDVYLVAKQFTNAAGVTMWGFAEDADSDLGTVGAEAATSPGPVIRVPVGDTTLTIHVRNDLGSDVSLFIPGQSKSMAPEFVNDFDGRRRVRSFDALTLAGSTNSYTWTNLKSGSYIYQSGTDIRTQVPMGMYGALIVYEAGGAAYPGIAPDNEAILFYSEADEAVNNALPPAQAGPAYQPQHFMINGASFPDAAPIYDHPPAEGETLLLRFFNIGLDTSMPVLNGLLMKVIAEDGYLQPAASMPDAPGQYSLLLPAGKTFDALVMPGEGSYVLFDRALRLDSGLDTMDNGGQMVSIDIAAAAPPEPPFAADNAYDVEELQALDVPAPGVLANDTDANGDSLTAVLDTDVTGGTLTLNVDGSFSYTPNTGTLSDSFTYFANDGTSNSDTAATVTITVNPNVAPVAEDDAWIVSADVISNVPDPGVLGNDTDANGDPLTVILVGDASSGGTLELFMDGSFDYTPNAGSTGGSFTYRANDGALDSNVATVTLTVNQVPVANDDVYETDQDVQLVVDALTGVLANDTDGNISDSLTAALVTGPATGAALNLSPDGSFTYTPNPGYSGDDSFTYVANDASADSAPATVTITVNAPNAAPVAVNDGEYLVVKGVNFDLPADGVLANDTDVDGDPLTAAVVSTPANGAALTLNLDGSFSYYVPLGEEVPLGADSFTYVANDGTQDSNVATVSIWVNAAPEARDDAASFTRRRAWINVVANDSDEDGFIVGATVEIVTPPNPAVGSIQTIDTTGGNAGRVRYRYNTNRLRGTGDEFTYRVQDDRGTWSNVVRVEVNGGP